jgi:hypothetical protein
VTPLAFDGESVAFDEAGQMGAGGRWRQSGGASKFAGGECLAAKQGESHIRPRTFGEQGGNYRNISVDRHATDYLYSSAHP